MSFISKRDETTTTAIKSARQLVELVQAKAGNHEGIIEILKEFKEFRPSQNDSEIIFMMDTIHANKLKTICEIGTFKGGSLFCFCQAAPADARLITIDIALTREQNSAFKQFAKKGQNLTCIKGSTKAIFTYLKVKQALRGRQIDLLFIDGDHSFMGVVNDFVRYSPLVKKGGLIIFHDVQPLPPETTSQAYVGEVPVFWQALKQAGYKTEEVIENNHQEGKGLGVLYI